MSQDRSQHHRSAPCIVDSGTIVNKEDMKRLLKDLLRVNYSHTIDGNIQSQGEGWITEIFVHPDQSTLVANGNIYINLQSFDYLQLNYSADEQTCFDLIQDNRRLRLIPLSNASEDREATPKIDIATIEYMVTKVISDKWDVQLDLQLDDDDFNCEF